MSIDDKHVHKFKNPELRRVKTDNPKYIGPTMGFVIKKCECGLRYVTDYKKLSELKKTAT